MAILSDEFYYQPIRIDTINTRIYADIVAKEGDANGRGLLLTLTENGLMKDTTGITLLLKWEHTSVGNQGLDNFEVVDQSKGLYKITYPTEMLNRGKVRAFIQIIDSGKLAGTRNIEITVDRGVGDDTAIVSSDSFTALASALIEVQSWNDRIDIIEQEFIYKSNNLESTYAPDLFSVKQQLAEKADITTALGIQSQVNSLVLGAVGEGNNAEVVQARGIYATLNSAVSSKADLGYHALGVADVVRTNEELVNPTTGVRSYNGNAYTLTAKVGGYEEIRMPDVTTADGQGYAFFDALGVFISGGMQVGSYDSVDIPSGAMTFVCTINNAVVFTIMELHKLTNTIMGAAARIELLEAQQPKVNLVQTSNFEPVQRLKSEMTQLYRNTETNYATITETEEGTLVTINNTGLVDFYLQLGQYSISGDTPIYVVCDYAVNSFSGTYEMTERNITGSPLPTTLGNHTEVFKSEDAYSQFNVEFKVLPGATVEVLFKKMGIIWQVAKDTLTVAVVKDHVQNNSFTTGGVYLAKASLSKHADTSNHALVADSISGVLSSWEGKVWVSYGDSNTENGGWQTVVTDRLGLIHTNKGIGGTTACGTDALCGWQDVRINSFPSVVDLVTVMFGTNDWSGALPIGTDNGDTTTFMGALGVIVRKIQTNHPDARIVLMSPPFRPNSEWTADPVVVPYDTGDNKDMKDFIEAVEYIAKKYGCPFVDSWGEMGVNEFNFKNYLFEEVWPVHLNTLGRNRLGEVLIGAFREIEPVV